MLRVSVKEASVTVPCASSELWKLCLAMVAGPAMQAENTASGPTNIASSPSAHQTRAEMPPHFK